MPGPGPLVFWSGGAGAAPPPVPTTDRFAPKYLVGNQSAGDGTPPQTTDGFIFILDSGDGSGVASALSQPNGPGDVYVRPGTYTGAGVLTIPAGVEVRGAGKELTKFSGFTFRLNSDASLQDVGIVVTTGFGVDTITSATGIKLADLNVESSGLGCILLEGPGAGIIPIPRQSTVERVFCTVNSYTTGFTLRNGAIVSAQNLRITGGRTSIEIYEDSSLFGSKIFTDLSGDGAIKFLINTGLGVTHVSDSMFSSRNTSTLQSDGNFLSGVRFLNCVVRGLDGSKCIDISNFADTLFEGCDLLSEDTNSIGDPDGVFFENCKIVASGVNGTLFVFGAPNSGYISLNNCVIGYIGFGGVISVVGSNSPISMENCVISTTVSITGLSLLGVGGSTVSSTKISTPGLNSVVVGCPNNVFSGNQYKGAVIYIPSSDGNVDSGSIVDNSAHTGPAIVVRGSENTFTSIRTKTQALTPGIEFLPTAQNNIVLALNAKGPGSGVLAVLDAGITNEVAHVIGT